MKFRKKPIVVDAVKYTGDYEQMTQLITQEGFYVIQGEMYIKTLEGDMHVSRGDWIITGVHGEKYPCKPDVFAESYEPVIGLGD